MIIPIPPPPQAEAKKKEALAGVHFKGKYAIDSSAQPVRIKITDMEFVLPPQLTEEEVKMFRDGMPQELKELIERTFIGELEGPAKFHIQPFKKDGTPLDEKPEVFTKVREGEIRPAPSQPASPGAAARGTTPPDKGYNPSFAFVDMNKIFKEYSRTKDAEAKIKATTDAATKEIEDEKLRVRTEIVDEITAAIERIAGEGDTIILDRSGLSLSGVPFVMFSPDAADMSERVTSKLNRGTASLFSAAPTLNFATVDMNAVFQNYKKTKNAEAEINKARDVAKQEFDKKANQYKKLLEEIDQLNKQLESATMSEDSQAQLSQKRDNKVVAIKKMEREINDFRARKEKALQERAMKMREGIVGEMVNAITKILPRQSVPVIFDKSGMSVSNAPILLFVALPDLSEPVTATLNSSSSARRTQALPVSRHLPARINSGLAASTWIARSRPCRRRSRLKLKSTSSKRR